MDTTRTSTGLRVAAIFAVQAITVGIPVAAVLSVEGMAAAHVAQLPQGVRLVPEATAVTRWLPVVLAAVAFAFVPALGLTLGWLRGAARWVMAVVVLLLHVLVLVGGCVGGVGVAAPWKDRDRLLEAVPSPDGSERALLYEARTSKCGLSVYTAPRAALEATYSTGRTCTCGMPLPEAHVVWASGKPRIVDPGGAPWRCPPPPRCTTLALDGAGWWGIALAALAVLRGRRRTRRLGRPADEPPPLREPAGRALRVACDGRAVR